MKLNPNKKHVEKIRRKLEENEGYCPCAIVKTEDTKCPCKEQREANFCRCQLYVEDDFNER